jgi:lipopolysaccharide biosynthesis glycosyltransferase
MIFTLCIILICFFLYFVIFGLHYKLKSKIPINKEKDKVKEKHKGVSIKNNPHINYDDFAKKLFNERKAISFDYLNETLFGTKRDYSNFDNIHVLFAFNNDYYLLASVTITSILKTANNNSFIHIHIIASKGFKYETMKKLNSLKEKINKNVEFIFYDGSKAEDDFGSQIKNEKYGVGEYAKLLGSILVDKNIDRIIALDAGDLLIQKDLLELYNYPLDDYLVMGAIDPFAPCLSSINTFFLKEGYLNAGVFLYNLKKWREMGIYNDIVKFYKYLNFSHKLPTPHQDFINCFLPSILVGLLPIKYNLQEYIDIKNPNNYRRGTRLYTLRCSYFYGKKDEILEGAKNVVIWHYNHAKINNGHGAPFLTRQWKKYAKISGVYKEIKRRYPKAFFRK